MKKTYFNKFNEFPWRITNFGESWYKIFYTLGKAVHEMEEWFTSMGTNFRFIIWKS